MKDYNINDFALHNLTFKTYPKQGWDIYEIRIYWKGAYLTTVEADGLEVEMFRYKDNPDPDSKTYDEYEEFNKFVPPTVKMENALERKTREWKEGMKFGKKEDDYYETHQYKNKPTMICAKAKDMKRAKEVIEDENGWD